MFWNARGANNLVTRHHIKSINESVKAVICCIQETKCPSWEHKAVCRLGLGSNIGWVDSPSNGLSGGLLTIWNQEVFSVTNIAKDRNWIMISGQDLVKQSPFTLINVYAPQKASQKIHLWTELTNLISSSMATQICLVGDFNAVKDSSERSHCIHSHSISEAFNQFLTTNGLSDAPISNSSFTWYGPDNRKGRLDRALLSPELFSQGDWTLQTLHRHLSDHCPLILKSGRCDWGPKPFKFYNCWLQNQNLVQMLKASWKSTVSSNIQHKFKNLREVARKWNKISFGDVDVRIKEAEAIQEANDQRKKTKVVSNEPTIPLKELYKIKSSMLCQQARINWQLQGENNTKFFHRALARRRAFNTIRKIKHEDDIVSKPSDIKKVLHDHFKSFLSDSHIQKIFDLGTVISSHIDMAQSRLLEAEFSLSEIESALHNTDKSKAPGPDGLNAGVLEALWPDIKQEVLVFFTNFHKHGFLPKGSNSSFIALIPKSSSALVPKDYRPISLMNALMKLLTKVLAARLKKVMHNLVAPNQSAFIKGRQIYDGILLTSEIVSLLQKKKSEGIVFKIDFEKAFDRVQWHFVSDILEAMKFGQKWIFWIMSIFKSSKISVLVNGSPSDEFTPSRGLRQG